MLIGIFEFLFVTSFSIVFIRSIKFNSNAHVARLAFKRVYNYDSETVGI